MKKLLFFNLKHVFEMPRLLGNVFYKRELFSKECRSKITGCTKQLRLLHPKTITFPPTPRILNSNHAGTLYLYVFNDKYGEKYGENESTAARPTKKV